MAGDDPWGNDTAAADPWGSGGGGGDTDANDNEVKSDRGPMKCFNCQGCRVSALSSYNRGIWRTFLSSKFEDILARV